jgi:hypothetical protein
MRQVHNVEHQGTLIEFLNKCLKAYEERTKALKGTPPIGETSIAQKLEAIIDMLKPLGSVPGDLGFAREEISLIHGLLANPQPKQLEVRFVFKVADDHQSESFSISIGGVTDAEGQPIADPSGLGVKVQSSDENVVAVSFDEASKSGSVSFGSPGVASVTATVTNAKGDILGSGAADFTVTTGDPAAVSDVKIAFGGLTEEPPA